MKSVMEMTVTDFMYIKRAERGHQLRLLFLSLLNIWQADIKRFRVRLAAVKHWKHS